MARSIDESANILLAYLYGLPRDIPANHTMEGPELAKALGLSAHEINDAVAILRQAGVVETLDYIGTHPYEFGAVSISARGRYEYERTSKASKTTEAPTQAPAAPVAENAGRWAAPVKTGGGMQKSELREAILQLSRFPCGPDESSFAFPQAVSQFNALLSAAQRIVGDRPDIDALHGLSGPLVYKAELADGIQRLLGALHLTHLARDRSGLDTLTLPADAPGSVQADLDELKGAVGAGLRKAALLLAGSIAEALLAARHPDPSARGLSLGQLLAAAKARKLFGEDTLRAVETLVNYRDLIHPRAGVRTQIVPDDARIHSAVVALKLLCSDLQDPNRRFPP